MIQASIPFNDLKPLHGLLAGELEAAALRVLASGWYILGPELEAFEQAFAAYHGMTHGVAHAVGVANGTDAIELALRALGIGEGDEVITVAHTAVATVCAVERTGATPVLVDIGEETTRWTPRLPRRRSPPERRRSCPSISTATPRTWSL